MKKIIPILTLLLFTGSLFSQIPENTNSIIDSMFSEWDNMNSPGCAVGVIKDGTVLFSKGYGSANLDYNIPISPNTSFHVASLTKQFTASCIALLILKGKIKLNDDIRMYIPDFPKYRDTIRIQHLIYHTSGLKDYPEMMSYIGNSLENFNSSQNVFDIIYSSSQLLCKPGEKMGYCNSGYSLMLKIIENVSGMPMNEFASKNIFEPLGMNHTFYNENPSITIPNKALSYDKDFNGVYQKHYINTPCIGSGNIVTTLNDLLLWENNFHNNSIFPTGYIDLITRKGVLNNGDTLSYAFGIGYGEYQKIKTISHSGSVNCYESKILRIPDYKISVVILSNAYYMKALLDNNELAEKVAGVYLQNELGNPDTKIEKTNFNSYPTTKIISDFTGTYLSDKGLTWIFKKQHKYRIVHSFNDWFDSMLPVNDSLCADEYAPKDFYQFNLDKNKNIVSMNFTYTGLSIKAENKFSASSLTDYPGIYYSDELNSLFKINVVGNKLFCEVNNNPAIELFYIDERSLKLENMLFESFGNDRGIITNLKISGDMGGNIQLKRIKFE
jgi:CubicO group peptidase (beta-lactamase class C family)